MKPDADSEIPATGVHARGEFDLHDLDEDEGLDERPRRLATGVPAIPLRMRVLGAALVAGLTAVVVVGALHSLRGSLRARRAQRPRHRLLHAAGVAVGRSLAREAGARMLLGAAGVLGARLAGDVLVPALVRQLTDGDGPEQRASPSQRRTARRSKRGPDDEVVTPDRGALRPSRDASRIRGAP